LTIPLAIWIQSTNVTDKWTGTGRQQRLRLRIASRGNKVFGYCYAQELTTENNAKIIHRHGRISL